MQEDAPPTAASPSASKFVYRVPRRPRPPLQPEPDQIPQQVNAELDAIVKEQKDLISARAVTRQWDRFKRLANDYELVFTAAGCGGVAACAPVSRSFFKLWEMLTDLEPQLGLRREALPACRAAFLAEGPGGFVEAFCRYRGAEAGRDDALFGMTLLSPDRAVPSWKLSRGLLKAHNVQLLGGEDGTGSLLVPANVENLVRCAGEHACHLVTADGGFDFSGSYNEQEVQGTRLIQAEVYAALRLQAPGGHLVLKLFDMYTPRSYQLLYILNQLYGTLYFVKPLTSRPANSERYVVGVGFRGLDTPGDRAFLADALDQLRATVAAGGEWRVTVQPCTPFLYDVAEFNAHYMVRQVVHIHRTVALIGAATQEQAGALEAAIRERQVRMATAWCEKYGIALRAPRGATTRQSQQSQESQQQQQQQEAGAA